MRIKESKEFLVILNSFIIPSFHYSFFPFMWNNNFT